MSSTIKTAYRFSVPSSVRMSLRFYRGLAKSFLIDDPRSRREFMAKIRRHTGRHLVRVPVNGFQLKVSVADIGVGYPLFVDRRYEPGELDLITQSLRPGMTFLDLGANIGLFTTLAAKLVGPTGKVLAFEPEPLNYRLLRENLERNRLSNVIAIERAAGECAGIAHLHLSDDHNNGDHRLYSSAGCGHRTVQIEVTTVDETLEALGNQHVDFIKIDVQGYEAQVIRGMERTLWANRKIQILMEYWPHGIRNAGASPEALLEFFQSREFCPTAFMQDGSREVVSWEGLREIMSRLDHCNSNHYANVFLSRD